MERVSALNQKAAAFRALHVPGAPLLLANAWDAASARIVEDAGARAIATSSAALANSRGYPDGEVIPLEEMVAVTRRITGVAGIPVSADIEAGYGAGASEAAETAALIMEAGAIGINIEDGTDPAELLAEKIRAVRERAARDGRELFINARADVFLRGLASGKEAVDETIRRLRLYASAGADGVFVPGLTDIATIAAIAKSVTVPLNVLVIPGLADVAALAEAGVARVSLGSAGFLACLSLTRRIAQEFLETGTYRSLHDGPGFTQRAANALFANQGGRD